MTQDKPFFSIVVPTYNRANLIEATIRSLLNQSYQEFEIIIVDDGSTDDTEAVIKKIEDQRISYITKDNAERAAARNFGARLSKGDYVNFFDSDDIALDNHLEEAVKVITRSNQPSWFHLGYAWATPEHQVVRNVDSFAGDTLNDLLPYGNPLSCNGVFVRKDVILDNPFNEERDLSASEDYELWLRLGARFPLHYSNVITSWVIDHEFRSVRTINYDKLIKRLEHFLKATKSDKKLMHVYGKQYAYLEMDAFSYIAVHLADKPVYKAKSIRYLGKSLNSNPRLLKTKRFYATIKNLIFKW